jgi:hypothetical protein
MHGETRTKFSRFFDWYYSLVSMVLLIIQNSFLFTLSFIDKTIISFLCVICNVVGNPENGGIKFPRKKIHFN